MNVRLSYPKPTHNLKSTQCTNIMHLNPPKCMIKELLLVFVECWIYILAWIEIQQLSIYLCRNFGAVMGVTELGRNIQFKFIRIFDDIVSESDANRAALLESLAQQEGLQGRVKFRTHIFNQHRLSKLDHSIEIPKCPHEPQSTHTHTILRANTILKTYFIYKHDF